MNAMILAAGFGTRLFPLTIDRTKPAIPFLGKPLVGYVAEYLSHYGFRDIVVNLHHQPESVKLALGKGERFGVNINYTIESPNILGTAGALDNARHLLEGETFLVVNGKIITDIDISAALKTHRETGALATMILKENLRFERFTEVIVQNNEIKAFASGFPIPNPKSQIQKPLMFTGIQILEPRVFEYIPRGVYSDIVPTFYRPAIERGEKIVAHVTKASWHELSTIPRYLDISLAMLQNADVFKGERCSIHESARVSNSILWDDVVIEENVILNRAIIGDGVIIPSGSRFENVAIVRAEMLTHAETPAKALEGNRVGENFVVSLDEAAVAV